MSKEEASNTMNMRLQKLVWRSRRGMLEMDVLFQDYLSKYGAQLNGRDLDDLEDLLALDDPILFDAFSGKTMLEDDRLNNLFIDIKGKIGRE